MGNVIEDGYEAQYAAQEAVFAEDGKRYCERCGNELTTSDAFLCARCDLSRGIDG